MEEPRRPYSIRLTLEPNPGGVYTVTSPDVPGLVTEGRTPDEILRNVQEALDALKQAWRELGIEIPAALRPTLGDRPQTVEMLVCHIDRRAHVPCQIHARVIMLPGPSGTYAEAHALPEKWL